MVVLKPTLENEYMLTCTQCSAIGLGSPVRERSSFYAQRQRYGCGYRSVCRACSIRDSVRRQKQRKKTAKQRATERAWFERNRERCRRLDREARRRARERDPEGYTKQMREKGARYRAKLAADPERLKIARENAAIDRQLRAERRGASLRTPKTSTVGHHHHPKAIGPFRYWLNQLIALEEREKTHGDVSVLAPLSRVTARLGLAPRRVWSYRNTDATVDEFTIDRAATAEGVRLEDIYCDTGVMHGPERRP